MHYSEIAVENPFNAPVLFCKQTSSTMNDIREMSKNGAQDGTVILTEIQNNGRGRIEGRKWDSEAGESLLCSFLLRRKPVEAFSLKIGLAVAKTIDFFLHRTHSQCSGQQYSDHQREPFFALIKWPNDVLCFDKKISGILCESDGDTIFVGIGINISQKKFDGELAVKAISLHSAIQKVSQQTSAFIPSTSEVLEILLKNIHLQLASYTNDTHDDWNTDLNNRLWKRGETVSFRQGDPIGGSIIKGVLSGIGSEGELLITSDEGNTIPLFSGELPYNE